MLTIGLTGGIGSGKTEVANLFAKRGVMIIDADQIARQVTEPHQPALKKIREHFGNDIFTEDDRLDRKKLRAIIFTDPNERNWLEKLLHPLIRDEIIKQLSQAQANYCIVVIPLLIEAANYAFLNRILVVDASEQIQLERVEKRDNIDPIQIKAILNAQTSRQARISQAHDLILNDGSLQDLERQVEKLHKTYLNLSKKASG